MKLNIVLGVVGLSVAGMLSGCTIDQRPQVVAPVPVATTVTTVPAVTTAPARSTVVIEKHS